MKEIMLINQSNSIFARIKNFIINLFKKKEMKKEEDILSNKNDFKKRIIIEGDKEKARLLNLQQKFENGNILEEDINEEDFIKLHELYDEQIEAINKETEMYKKRILEIKAKLNKTA